MRHTGPVAIAIGCLAVGFIAGQRWSTLDRVDPPLVLRDVPLVRRDVAPEPHDGPATLLTPPDADLAPAATGREVLSPQGYFSAALMEYFEREFRSSWEALRAGPPGAGDLSAGGSRFEAAVLSLPAELGQTAARDHHALEVFRDALARGDGVRVLEAVADAGVVLADGELDDDFFDRILRPRASTITVDGPSFTRDRESVTDGMTLSFDAGLHSLHPARLPNGRCGEFPADLTLRGAGMDATRLSLQGELVAGTAIRRLRIVGLTLDCGNNYLFDVRGDVVTLELENVRVVRFDKGSGKSVVFGTREGLLVRARNCAFIDGYGKLPGSGNLFHGAAWIASFEGCLFDRVDLNLNRPVKGRVRFIDCTFENYAEDPTRTPSAVFERPTLLPLRTRAELAALGRASLSDLFPDWDDR